MSIPSLPLDPFVYPSRADARPRRTGCLEATFSRPSLNLVSIEREHSQEKALTIGGRPIRLQEVDHPTTDPLRRNWRVLRVYNGEGTALRTDILFKIYGIGRSFQDCIHLVADIKSSFTRLEEMRLATIRNARLYNLEAPYSDPQLPEIPRGEQSGIFVWEFIANQADLSNAAQREQIKEHLTQMVRNPEQWYIHDFTKENVRIKDGQFVIIDPDTIDPHPDVDEYVICLKRYYESWASTDGTLDLSLLQELTAPLKSLEPETALGREILEELLSWKKIQDPAALGGAAGI